MIRRALVMIGLMACGSENPPAATPSEPGSAQQLVIPPMDAGAAPPMVVASSTSSPSVEDHPDGVDEYSAGRDPRAKTAPRAGGMISAEIQGLETLLKGVTSNSPQRPEILRKLMDDYAELARAAGSASAAARTALDSSIAYGATLIKDHPMYARLDEVRYNQGLAFEQAQKTMDARKSFYELIKTRPDSKFIGCAYFAFGEMFHEEEKSDPSRADLAKQAYLEAAKFPAPGNSCFKLAKDRLRGR